MVEHGDNRQREKGGESDRDQDLLRRPPLGARAYLHAPLKEGGIFKREVDADEVGGDGEDDDKDPTLPISQRCGRPEDEAAEEDQSKTCGSQGAEGELHTGLTGSIEVSMPFSNEAALA